MHVFLYEWATGGGLVEAPGPPPAPLLREGAAMVAALAGDLVRIPASRVTVLRDPRVLELALPGCRIVDVLSAAGHLDEFERMAATADVTLLIAPEFDRILFTAARRAAACGARLYSPSAVFIDLTADKQATCDALAAAEVPTPNGVSLDPDEPLPDDFPYPAILKPRDGAGSQETYLVSGPHDAVPPYAWPRRLERFLPGLAASVAFLCGPAGRTPLMPCKQRLSDDGRFQYTGGELPLAAGLAARATALADRALAALPSATGYVGVDLVLGREPDGSQDAVVEINPRLTTSYVGLRAAATANLAERMLRAVQGEHDETAFKKCPLEFDAEGNVSFIPVCS